MLPVVFVLILLPGTAGASSARESAGSGSAGSGVGTTSAGKCPTAKAASKLARCSSARRKTSLKVRVVNVPPGVAPDVDVKGPGVKKHLVRTKKFTPAAVGKWTITAHNLGRTSDTVWPSLPRQIVKVRRGKSKVVTVDYSIVVPKTTEVLAAAKVTNVSPGAGGVTTVTLGSAAPVDVGDTLAVGVGSATPYGLLGKVTSVSASKTQMTIDAGTVSLLDAVSAGHMDVSMPLTSSDVAGSRAHMSTLRPEDRKAQLRLQSAPGSKVTEGLKENFSCAAQASAELSGSVSMAPTVNFKADWSLFKGVTSATVSAGIVQSAQLTATLNGSGGCELKRTALLAKPITFRPITITVGPVPVVLVPTVQFFADGSASFEASAKAGMSQRLDASVGLTYSKGSGFRPTQKFSNKVTQIGPEFKGEAQVEAGVAPEVNVLIYGIGGPRMYVRGSVEADAQAHATPAGAFISWNLDLRLKGAAALDIDKLKLHSGELSLFNKKFDIANGRLPYTAPPPVITTTSLPNGTVGNNYSQTLGTQDGRPGEWTIASGALPAGLALSATGTISGTPTVAGTSNFTVRFTDHQGGSDTQALSIVVAPGRCHPGTYDGAVIDAGDFYWIQFNGNFPYSGTIAWGDGATTATSSPGYWQHTYNTPGTYTVRITGSGTFGNPPTSCTDNITTVVQVQ